MKLKTSTMIPVALLFSTFVTGCGGASSPTMPPNPGNGSNGGSGGSPSGGGGGSGGNGGTDMPPVQFLQLSPDPGYTGFDGTHAFVYQVASDLTGQLTFTTADATVATIAASAAPKGLEDIGLAWATVTIKKAGTTTVSVTDGKSTETAKVTATAYTADQWTAGQTRYMTAPTGVLACATCHSGAGGVDHTSTYTSFYSDAELGDIIVKGTYPGGMPLRAPNHTFTVSDAEKAGLIAYLRALPPK